MSRVDPNQGLMASLFDRLTDPDSGGTIARPGYSVQKMTEVVQRDLEDLLNTRQTHVGLPAEFEEVHNSIIAYGLPDLTSLNAVAPHQRAEIGQVLEAIITRFEPRLKDVRATMVEGDDEHERRVRFRIEARLCLDPAPEVAFDTILELTTGRTQVEAGT